MLLCIYTHRCRQGLTVRDADANLEGKVFACFPTSPTLGIFDGTSGSAAENCGTAGDIGDDLGLFLRSASRLGRARRGEHRLRLPREAVCLANMHFTGVRSVLSLPPMAAMPQALTHRTVSD